MKSAKRYFVSSFVVALFGIVYEVFSHGVISFYMVCAFIPSLLLGALPYAVSSRFGKEDARSSSEWFHRYGIVLLTVGMIFKGIIEIYGTDSPFEAVYFIAASVFFSISIILRINEKLR